MKSTDHTETQRKRIPGSRNTTQRPGGRMSREVREERGEQVSPGTVGQEGVGGHGSRIQPHGPCPIGPGFRSHRGAVL